VKLLCTVDRFHDVMATIFVDLNKEMAALLVDQNSLRGIGHLHDSVILPSGPECYLKILSLGIKRLLEKKNRPDNRGH